MSQAALTTRWRHFTEQWRHCYLLLAAVFWCVWRYSILVVIPTLQNIRMGGLHPVDVLLLRDLLSLTWIPLLIAIVLYAASFANQRLNAPAAVAISALSSSVTLAVILAAALLRLSF